MRSVSLTPSLLRENKRQPSAAVQSARWGAGDFNRTPAGSAFCELYASGLKHGTDLGQLFRGRRLPGKRSLGFADRVASNAASTDRNLPAVPAE